MLGLPSQDGILSTLSGNSMVSVQSCMERDTLRYQCSFGHTWLLMCFYAKLPDVLYVKLYKFNVCALLVRSRGAPNAKAPGATVCSCCSAFLPATRNGNPQMPFCFLSNRNAQCTLTEYQDEVCTGNGRAANNVDHPSMSQRCSEGRP